MCTASGRELSAEEVELRHLGERRLLGHRLLAHRASLAGCQLPPQQHDVVLVLGLAQRRLSVTPPVLGGLGPFLGPGLGLPLFLRFRIQPAVLGGKLGGMICLALKSSPDVAEARRGLADAVE